MPNEYALPHRRLIQAAHAYLINTDALSSKDRCDVVAFALHAGVSIGIAAHCLKVEIPDRAANTLAVLGCW